MKGTDLKKKSITRFVLIVCGLILLNILSSKLHSRLDATAEKRFSLSQPTKNLLKNLKDVVVIEVYLKGRFPSGFQRLAESAREVLQEFQEYGGRNVRFSFVNPLEGKTEAEKQKVYINFSEKGLNPVNLKIQRDEEDGYAEKIIFPVAKVSFNQKDLPVNLLENHLNMNPNEKLNYSETMLEYKLASAIKQLMQPDRKKIAYIVGHDEMLGPNTADMLTTLEKYYDVDTLDLTKDIEIKRLYQAAIVCGPQETFSEQDKFKIDQYVMQGGKMLWLIDALRIEMDSLQKSEATMAVDYTLNLDDLLFNYGVRINPDLIEDYQQANPIPITVGSIGDQPDIRLLPWSYYPFSIPNAKHPIVNNMDAVSFKMTSSLDIITNSNIQKTVLLTSSNRSRKVPSPVRISLANLKFKPTPEMFREKNIPLAVLLEGKFNSIYTNRIDPGFIKIYTDSLKRKYNTVCTEPNKMIVVSDAHVFSNDYSQKQGIMECGFYKYTQQLFANKIFLLNCIEYLTDNAGLPEARNKDVKLRLLDMARVKKEKIRWQVLNIALPIALVMMFASAYFFFRRKRYEGKV
jgi:gliding-associated putative ABC transporter substrate-binding component GldG